MLLFQETSRFIRDSDAMRARSRIGHRGGRGAGKWRADGFFPLLKAGIAPAFFVFVLPAKTGYQRCLSKTESIEKGI
jgi:hypothetical protein